MQVKHVNLHSIAYSKSAHAVIMLQLLLQCPYIQEAYHLHYAVMQQRCLYIIVHLNLGVGNKQISKVKKQNNC